MVDLVIMDVTRKTYFYNQGIYDCERKTIKLYPTWVWTISKTKNGCKLWILVGETDFMIA